MNSFDLERAIALWRRQYRYRGIFLREDLDELERHLRDHIAYLQREGRTPQQAFHEAVQALGDSWGAETEYRKVYWRKLKRHGKRLSDIQWRLAMLKNYLKIALRNLKRHPGSAFINVSGLALGLACFVLILLFIQHEFSYDHFHEDADRIYRVIQQRPSSNGLTHWSVTSPAMAHTLAAEFAEVTLSTTVGRTYNPLLSLGDQHHQEEGILADDNFFNLFSFPLLQGNPQTALAKPNNLVLTERFARKVFGNQDPMGRTLIYQNDEAHLVTGVMADVPETSHLNFDFILPAQSDFYYRDGLDKPAWYNNGWFTYVLLNEKARPDHLEAEMRAYVDKHLTDWQPEQRMAFLFQPLTDIHLRSPKGISEGGDIKNVYFFAIIGIIILLLACVNYTNLAVARSIKRSREVGLRKVVGAHREQLIGQFLGESILVTFVALVFALVLVHPMLPVFERLIGRPIGIDLFGNPLLLPGLLLLVVFVGLLAGSYPALFMASLQPKRVLAGKTDGRARRFRVQHLLIVGQYTASIALIVCSIVVYQQIQFMHAQDLGYQREHIVTVDVNDEKLSENYEMIRNTWLRDPSVVSVTYSKHLPTFVGNMQSMYGWEGSNEGELLPTRTTSIDYDFLDLYDIEVVAGRNFSRAFSTDTLGAPVALVNEATVSALGWTPEEALGKQFGYTDGSTDRIIVGVLENFHFNSLRSELGPLVLTLDRFPTGYLSVKVRSDNLSETLALFKQTVGQISPYPFVYQFMDERFDQLYKREAHLGETFSLFTLLALVIASLGLFGLAAFTAEQRTKEIGVRKVLGATVPGIVILLSKDFLKLVALACVIAIPLSYFVAQRWLEDFAYHIDISGWIFLIAGSLTLAIALLTVSYQAVKAAVANPVKSLRYE